MKKLFKQVLNFFSNKKSRLNSEDFWIPVSESEQNNTNRIIVPIPSLKK